MDDKNTSKKKWIIAAIAVTLIVLLIGSLVAMGGILVPVYFRNDPQITNDPWMSDDKPVIYLYPEETMDVSVQLEYDGELICTYPAYNGGWNVTAHPDGVLIDTATGLEYSYLFWEGITEAEYDMSKGYVVAGEDTAEFLQTTLAAMGLTPKEYNEFIVYWLPRMQDNPYNLITFQEEVYTESAKLHVNPQPDSILRVFMVFQSLEEPIEVEKPVIESFEREGFTVVEWGGSEMK